MQGSIKSKLVLSLSQTLYSFNLNSYTPPPLFSFSLFYKRIEKYL